LGLPTNSLRLLLSSQKALIKIFSLLNTIPVGVKKRPPCHLNFQVSVGRWMNERNIPTAAWGGHWCKIFNWTSQEKASPDPDAHSSPTVPSG